MHVYLANLHASMHTASNVQVAIAILIAQLFANNQSCMVMQIWPEVLTSHLDLSITELMSDAN